MQQTLNTPYFQVQAIRRKLRDAGKPTWARPTVYPTIVNFTTGNAGEVARAPLTIDPDSDFVWTHLYHYFQLGVYAPTVGSVAANNTSGQFLDGQAAFQVDIRVSIMGSRKAVHDADFAFDLFSDSFYAAVSGLPGSFSDESELMGVAVAGVVGGTDINNAISIYRAALAEPVLVPASTVMDLVIRRRVANALRPMNGHVFLLSGVRLFPQGRA